MRHALIFTPTIDRAITKDDVARALAKAAYKVSKGETQGHIIDLHSDDELGKWELCEMND